MTAGIRITGATFTNGSTILGDDASPTVFIQPWYITNEGQFGSVVSLGGGSWVVSPGATIADSIYFEAAALVTLNEWYAKFSNAGFDSNYSYAWNATWATGGTTVVRMAIGTTGTNTGDPNLMKVIPIDTTITGWETNSVFSTLAKSGTYSLPVTFTPYVPTTQMTTNWT